MNKIKCKNVRARRNRAVELGQYDRNKTPNSKCKTKNYEPKWQNAKTRKRQQLQNIVANK